jgi:hypothetical protein
MRQIFVEVQPPQLKNAHSAKIEIGPSMACYFTVYQSVKYKESDLSDPPHATILCYGSLRSSARSTDPTEDDGTQKRLLNLSVRKNSDVRIFSI